MFKKNCVDLVYRVICLVTFVFVIIFSKSLITLAALPIFFFFITKGNNDFLFVFFYLASILFFAIAYFTDNYVLLKIINIIEFSYYFLNIPRFNKVIDNKVNVYLDKRLNITEEKEIKEEKGETIEKEDNTNESEIDYIRFKPSRKTKKIEMKNDLISTLYLTIHLFILFISIAIG